MENSVSMFGNSDSQRSPPPTRLQRRAPAALILDLVPENPLLNQSCNAVAIPLLSPLYVSPNASAEGDDFRFPLALTEKKNESQPSSMEHKEGWPYSGKADHSNQMALLNMFETKFVLVDHSK